MGPEDNSFLVLKSSNAVTLEEDRLSRFSPIDKQISLSPSRLSKLHQLQGYVHWVWQSNTSTFL